MTTGEPFYDPQGSVDIPPEYGAQAETPAGAASAQQLAETAKQSAKQGAKQGADQVKRTVMSQAATQKDQAAQSLTTVSGAVNQAAQQLRQNNQEPMARAVESAATNIGQFADYLRARNVSDLIGEVEDFASRQPALFLSGAFLVGVLGARFLKSSRTGAGQSGASQQWRGGASTQTGQYGLQYRPYNNLNNPGAGANLTNGGLAYGRNLPPNESASNPRG